MAQRGISGWVGGWVGEEVKDGFPSILSIPVEVTSEVTQHPVSCSVFAYARERGCVLAFLES